MQNIIQMEDDIKGMPDQTLQMLARQPSSQVPQFLVVSEIQRRTDMRKRFEAQKQQPQGSVSDRIVDEGLASLAPPPQMQAPMQPQQMPQQMAAGGVVGMYGGGMGISRKPIKLFGEDPLKDTIFDLEGRRKKSFQNMTGRLYAGKPLTQTQQGVYRQYAEEFGLPPNIEQKSGFFSANIEEVEPEFDDVDLPYSPPQPDPFAQGAQDIRDIAAFSMSQKGVEPSIESKLEEVEAFSSPEIQPQDTSKLTSNAVTEDATVSPLETAIAQVAAARGKKSDAEFNYQALIDRANKSAEQYTREAAERAEDLRKESKKDMLSSALIELGAGIAAGDLAGGLSRAGRSAADIKQTASTQARAEEAEARRLAEAARQRGEGFSIEAFKSAQEQERYDQQLDIAAKEFAAKILSDEEDRGLRERLAGADRDAALERLAASFANDQSLLDQKQTEARRLFNEGKIQAGREALGDAINKYINSASFQKRIEFMEPEEKQALIESETQRIRDSVGDLYEYKPSVSFADRK